MNKLLLIALSVIICSTAFGQQNKYYDVTHNGDCISAIDISILDTTHAIASPKGHGKTLEFRNNDTKSLLYIEREHHTVWYQFELPADAKLSFEIIPNSINDDYDFMLFEQNTENPDNFCQALMDKTIKPIRTNISRNNKEIQSKTGLRMGSNNQNTVHSGPGDDYSQFIEGKKGTRYFLLVDNVYKNGKGHALIFNYQPNEVITAVEKVEKVEIVENIVEVPKPKKTVIQIAEYTLKGIVTDDETNQPIEAEVNLINSKTGKKIATTTSDPTTGEYKITLKEEAKKLPKQSYTLEIYKDGYFFDSEDIKPYDLPELSKIKSRKRIPKIKDGKVFRISNINFYGNEARPLPRSFPVFDVLLRTMKKNPTLKISIEGHTNGCGNGADFSRRLSKARAETVKKYLETKGIAADRIKSKGLSCTKMLYDNPQTQKEMMLNRRVEIRVLEY